MKRARGKGRGGKRSKRDVGPSDEENYFSEVLIQVIPYVRAIDLVFLMRTSKFCQKFIESKLEYWSKSLRNHHFGFLGVAATEIERERSVLFQLYEAYHRWLIDARTYAAARTTLLGRCNECFVSDNSHVILERRTWRLVQGARFWIHEGPSYLGLLYDRNGQNPRFTETFFNNLKSLSNLGQCYLLKRLSYQGQVPFTEALTNGLSVDVIRACMLHKPQLLNLNVSYYTSKLIDPDYLEAVTKIYVEYMPDTCFVEALHRLANVYREDRIKHYFDLILRYTTDKKSRRTFLNLYSGGLENKDLTEICAFISQQELLIWNIKCRNFLNLQLIAFMHDKSRIPAEFWSRDIALATGYGWYNQELSKVLCYLFEKQLLIPTLLLTLKNGPTEQTNLPFNMYYMRGSLHINYQCFRTSPNEVYEALEPLLPVTKGSIEWMLIFGFYDGCFEKSQFYQIFDRQGTHSERCRWQQEELRKRYPHIE